MLMVLQILERSLRPGRVYLIWLVAYVVAQAVGNIFGSVSATDFFVYVLLLDLRDQKHYSSMHTNGAKIITVGGAGSITQRNDLYLIEMTYEILF